MTRFLRFVKSAHFFAIAFTCVFGVFLTANAFALTCTDNKVAVRNSSNTPGSETCVGIHSVPYGWTLNCGNGSNGLSSCTISKVVSAAGCTSTYGDNYVLEYKKLKKKNYGSGSYYDPNWNVYYDPYYQSDDDWEHYGWGSREALPGHVVATLQSNLDPCPKCTGHGYSLGGDAYEAKYCLPCPWYGGADTTNEFTRGFGPGAVQGTSSDDGTYCIVGGTSETDDYGTFTSGSCTYQPDYTMYYVKLHRQGAEELWAPAFCDVVAADASVGSCRDGIIDNLGDSSVYSYVANLAYSIDEYAGNYIPDCDPHLAYNIDCHVASYVNGCVKMEVETLGCIQAILKTYENVGGDVLDELVVDYYID